MKKLLPVLLALLGIGAGLGAGHLLRPDPAELAEPSPCGDATPESGAATAPQAAPSPTTQEYTKLNNQFIVPVVSQERVTSLIVLSLSVEITKGQSQTVFSREPKLRDAFLQVLFNHANMGGFHGAFTDTANMAVLRRALKEAGRSVLGDIVSDVLITDLARQDI